MEGFKHVSNTWLIAQLIHPFIFYGFIMIAGWGWMDFSYLPLLIFFGFLFSLSGYLICIFLFNLLCRIKLSAFKMFLLWIIAMSSGIMIGTYFTCLLLFDSKTFFEIRFLIGPGIVAAIIAACIRFKQFISTINFLHENH